MPPRKTKPASGRKRTDHTRQATPARKLIAFEPEVLDALVLLGRDRVQSFQELADEAFADLLRKHGRPVDLKAALHESARLTAANDPGQRPGRRRR